jgi:hypothetical protein
LSTRNSGFLQGRCFCIPSPAELQDFRHRTYSVLLNESLHPFYRFENENIAFPMIFTYTYAYTKQLLYDPG